MKIRAKIEYDMCTEMDNINTERVDESNKKQKHFNSNNKNFKNYI